MMRYGCLIAVGILALIVGVNVGRSFGGLAGFIAGVLAAVVMLGMSRRFTKKHD